MHRFLARLLVFFVLFGNFSLAVEASLNPVPHEEQPAGFLPVADGDAVPADATNDGTRHSIPHQDKVCDHCCHGTAHYLGLPPESPWLSDARLADRPQAGLKQCHSRDSEPPLPPPDIRAS